MDQRPDSPLHLLAGLRLARAHKPSHAAWISPQMIVTLGRVLFHKKLRYLSCFEQCLGANSAHLSIHLSYPFRSTSVHVFAKRLIFTVFSLLPSSPEGVRITTVSGACFSASVQPPW